MKMRFFRAQGATEYLVLLAVVLIVALVSVALLGFFPGMASDAQMTQSQAYWKGTSPLQIIEWDVRPYVPDSTYAGPYLRIRNAGAYPLTLTKLVAGSNSITQAGIPSGYTPISLTFAPGEEKIIGYSSTYSELPVSTPFFWFCISGCTGVHHLNGASSVCSSEPNKGQLVVQSFGFEYTETINNQLVTKRQIGSKPLIIKCTS